MFRSEESSNRIELSLLVQDLLNFSVLGSLWLWGLGGLGGWGGRWLGVPPHTSTHMHTHACMVNMIISCKWQRLWGNPWEFPMMSYAHMHVCACMHVHACTCV